MGRFAHAARHTRSTGNFWLKAPIIGVAIALLCLSTVAAQIASSSAAGTSSGTPAEVQDSSAHIGSGSTIRAALPDSATAGNLIVVFVRWSNAAAITVADNNGNDWSDSGIGVTEWSDGSGAQVLYASDVAAGDTTVTVRFSAPVTSAALYVHEYAGLATADPVDRAAAGTGNGSRLSSRSITTRGDGELLFGAGASKDLATNAGNNFTTRIRDGGDITEDRIAADGHYRATAWIDNDADWVMQLVAFKPAGDNGGTPSSEPATSASDTPEPTTSSRTTATTSSAPSSSSTSRTPPTSSAPSTSSATRTPTSSAPTTTRSTSGPSGGSSCALPDFPDSSCTGVPRGTALTTYSGPCTITTDDTVVDAKTVNCSTLTVHAKNVQIKNSKINGNVWMDQDSLSNPNTWSMTITDTEVDAGAVDIPAICCGNYSLVRVNSHGGHNGAQCENGAMYCNITDSYLHGQFNGRSLNGVPYHLGGFLNDGGTPSTLIHNTVVCDHPVELENTPQEGGCTGDINLIPNFGIIQNVLIKDNLMGANYDSAYCTYGGEVGGLNAHANHVVYQNNVFERGPNDKCARYGPVTQFDINQPGNVWTGNVWDDGGAVLPSR